MGGENRSPLCPRKKDTLITRLRLHGCFLNKYLHKIGLHDSGLCDICRVPETVEHFLFNCPSHCFLTKSLYDTAEAFKHVPSIGLVLSEEPYQQLIYQYVKSHGIRL